jgi:hypothetical protein
MDDLIAKYQRSRRAVEDAKKALQEACDAARDATIPLAQAWLNENYPDVSAKVEPTGKDVELSINYVVLFTTKDWGHESKEQKETQRRIFNELEQYLKSVREEV